MTPTIRDLMPVRHKLPTASKFSWTRGIAKGKVHVSEDDFAHAIEHARSELPPVIARGFSTEPAPRHTGYIAPGFDPGMAPKLVSASDKPKRAIPAVHGLNAEIREEALTVGALRVGDTIPLLARQAREHSRELLAAMTPEERRDWVYERDHKPYVPVKVTPPEPWYIAERRRRAVCLYAYGVATL
jgi:hypothetical protein